MNNKLAIARIISEAPMDKIIRPVSNISYLKQMTGTSITFAINDMLKSDGMFEYDDWSESEENLAVRERNKELLKQYSPLTSAYNSMTLWTVNGAMIDESSANGMTFSGNTYTDRDCAIVDFAEPHADKCVSVNPIDFAIRGDIELSNNGKIIVTKKYFDNLPYNKQQVILNDKQFLVTDKPITEAVNDTLISMGINPEQMSFRLEDEGFKPSETSEVVKQEIEKFANQYDIPNVRHFNLLQCLFDPHKKLDFAKKEYDKLICVDLFYQRTFIDYLSKNMGLDSGVVSDCLYMPDSGTYIEQLFSEIKSKGIDRFKSVVTNYNNGLLELQRVGKLPTPQQIVDDKLINKDNYSLEQHLSDELCNMEAIMN